jgi:hypothetical protein
MAAKVTKHTDSKGNTKYYNSYQTAWNAANRLNEQGQHDGIWLFEADMTGWYVFLAPHGSN